MNSWQFIGLDLGKCKLQALKRNVLANRVVILWEHFYPADAQLVRPEVKLSHIYRSSFYRGRKKWAVMEKIVSLNSPTNLIIIPITDTFHFIIAGENSPDSPHSRFFRSFCGFYKYKLSFASTFKLLSTEN